MEGDHNHWLRTGQHWNRNLATFNARMLFSEVSLPELFEELTVIKWDVIGFRQVRTDEAQRVLKSWHVLCYCGVADRGELGVGFLIRV